MKVVVAALFLALQFYIYHWFASVEEHPARTSLTSFPLAVGDWRCAKREPMEPKVVENLGVTDYLICSFQRGGSPLPVDVYVGYHRSQVSAAGGGGGETRIHPPAHCLPGSGWDIIRTEDRPLQIPGLPHTGAEAKRLVIAKGEARQLVYYWYQERGRVIADDWMKIVYLFWDRARQHRTDGALVRFTTPIPRGDEAVADNAVLELAEAMLPLLPAYLPN